MMVGRHVIYLFGRDQGWLAEDAETFDLSHQALVSKYLEVWYLKELTRAQTREDTC